MFSRVRLRPGATIVDFNSSEFAKITGIQHPSSEQTSFPWYAIRVRSNFERIAAESLSHKGYDTFLPTYRCRKRRWDRTVDVEVPLFPSYLFCRFDYHQRLPVLISPGIVHIVGGGEAPIPVPEDEIATVRAIVESNLRAEPWPFLNLGERVRIVEGPLAGIEGILVEFKGSHRLVVSISLLQRSVAAVVEGPMVRPVRKSVSLATAGVERLIAAAG